MISLSKPDDECKAKLPAHSNAANFAKITAAELATANYDVQFHIPGIVPRSQPQGIFGAKKSLKTSLMLDQAIAISTGQPWLGHFPIEKSSNVAVFSAESGMATIQDTCRRICTAIGIDLAETGLAFYDTVPRFGDVQHMAELERVLAGDGIGVVYVDPVYLALDAGGHEGSLFAMGAMLRNVSEVCQRVGTTLVLLHHMRKGVADPYAPGDLDDASWAGFAEFCRSWQLINRRERYVPGSGRHKLWLTVGGSIGHSGLWAIDIDEGVYDGPGSRHWGVNVMHPSDARGEAVAAEKARRADRNNEKLADTCQAILNAAAAFPQGETVSTIRDAAGVSGTLAKQAISRLLQAGDLVPCEVVKSNRKSPYSGYKLNPN